MLTALDIETCCDVPNCIGFGGSHKCKHALDHNRNRITRIGLWNPSLSVCFKSVDKLTAFLTERPDLKFVAHGGKFDFKNLLAKGLDLRSQWKADTLLLSSVLVTKVTDQYLKNLRETTRRFK